MKYGTTCMKFGFINIWISDQHYPCPTWVLNDISNTIKIKDIQEELNNSISGQGVLWKYTWAIHGMVSLMFDNWYLVYLLCTYVLVCKKSSGLIYFMEKYYNQLWVSSCLQQSHVGKCPAGMN